MAIMLSIFVMIIDDDRRGSIGGVLGIMLVMVMMFVVLMVLV